MVNNKSHLRAQIRAKIVELLKSGATNAGTNVHDSRDLPINPDTTPAIIVYTQDEQISPDTKQDYGLICRTMTLSIECYIIGEDGAPIVDALAFEVENLMHQNPTLNNLVAKAHLQSTNLAFADDGSQTLHAALLSFEVTYYTHFEAEDNCKPPQNVIANIEPDFGPNF